jgi:hypothetical protein
MATFDPTNLPSQPNPMLQSNGGYAQVVITATGSVSMEPGDWVVLNPALGFLDPVRKNLFQVSNVLAANSIEILYSQDGGFTYQSVNLSSSWIVYVFRLQPGS